MRSLLAAVLLVLASGACSDDTTLKTPGGVTDPTAKPTKDGGPDPGKPVGEKDGGSEPSDPDGGKPPPAGSATVRIMAANITSGPAQSYDPGEGIRIFQGLKPDIALVQEMNYAGNQTADIEAFVAKAFGAEYKYYRETGNIPNGVVSRYPITMSGHWDSNAPDRGFAYAKIAVPGDHPLWAVSVHLLTANEGVRKTEATELVAKLKGVVAEGDYVVIGGDLNTDNRTEPCLTTLGAIVDAANSHAVDNNGNEGTNANRGKPYDWVLASPNLVTQQVPTVVGAKSFEKGLIFDSRVYTPLTDVAPVQKNDSAAQNMQHMAVVKDFKL